MGDGGRWALVSPDGVAPSRLVGVSASVNLPLHHKVQKFSSGTCSPGWSHKKGRKMVVVVQLWIMDFHGPKNTCYMGVQIWEGAILKGEAQGTMYQMGIQIAQYEGTIFRGKDMTGNE